MCPFYPRVEFIRCIVLLFDRNLLYESLGQSGRGDEFQDSPSGEKSCILHPHLLPAAGLKSHFSGNLRISKSDILSSAGPLWSDLAWSTVKEPRYPNEISTFLVKCHNPTFVSELGPAYDFSLFDNFLCRCYHRLKHSHKPRGIKPKSKRTHISWARHERRRQNHI